MASLVYGLLALLVGIGAFSMYKFALPKPLPGIPYDIASRKRVLGDLPDATAWVSTAASQPYAFRIQLTSCVRQMRERKEFWSFLQARCQQLNSPIVQVWMQPLGKPFIVVSDYLETQDIMVRRHAQFDRSAWLGDMFWAIAPRNMTRFLTNDDWRAHRRLMADAMSPGFLRNVASPHGHAGASSLIKLWKSKMDLAEGRPFSVFDDVIKSAMDAMWSAVFGSEISTTQGQIDALTGRSVLLSSDRNVPVEFPQADDPETFTAMLTLGNSVAWAASSPLPKTTHWLAVNLIPNLRRAMKLKRDYLSGMLHAASHKFATSQDEGKVKHVLDLVVQREVTLAKKEGRAPEFDTQDIRDELFGFLLAGNETTSATICWGLKMLSDHPRVQHKLRTILQEFHIQARQEGRTPSPQEMFNANIPYLEATLAEILRHAGSAPGSTRRTMENTEIFGHQIPKGYDVLMVSGNLCTAWLN